MVKDCCNNKNDLHPCDGQSMVKHPPPPSLREGWKRKKRTRKYRCELIENIHFPGSSPAAAGVFLMGREKRLDEMRSGKRLRKIRWAFHPSSLPKICSNQTLKVHRYIAVVFSFCKIVEKSASTWTQSEE
ncbi:hypothetical protein CEXT_405521 [Caerostris extrusa]|uniref:Uncharacterized protein n=1 Tax=Caerostris extrusa TaxID=172846 RepID=A0AAV4NWK7_CAEEX|nr:hypothetical protein CEXT_405521 [Caerostris extrusa]